MRPLEISWLGIVMLAAFAVLLMVTSVQDNLVAIAGNDCTACHTPDGLAGGATSRSTHTRASIAPHSNDGFAGAQEAPFTLTCDDCHSMHSFGKNIALVRQEIRGYTVVFTQTTGIDSFDEDSGDPSDTDDVCVTCHINTTGNAGYPMSNHDGGVHGATDYRNQNCTTCHPHDRGFMPMGGCTGCHATAQDNGDGLPPGGRRAVVDEFGTSSHHVQGTVEDGDCLVCHEMNTHMNGYVQLKNVDTAAVYDELSLGTFRPESITAANSKTLQPFCLSCHDADGAGGDTTPFSDGMTVPAVDSATWSLSAHETGGTYNSGYGCLGDGSSSGCHATGHGSVNDKLLADATVVESIDQLCTNCHTEGMVPNDALSNNRPGGYVSADDIQEAFAKSRKHDLGTSFAVGGDTFAFQCTSCHNPHVVTGKYWDAASGVSPVTRPDFSDPVNNPRAMGQALWGAAAGQKMDDFAALAAGTGGWYYKIAQGYLLGVTGLSFDQQAVYRPPKSGSGYDLEFGGDVLPDYTTLCLDCHSFQMSGSVGPVNWGQGIPTGYPEPPGPGYVNWVATSSPHGLNSANMSSYVSDSGTAGFWGSSGNPDVIFHMNYVTRGRHNGHFMRWPYDSAERGAGINFVLSCTDCHEAHGSDRGGMIRERFDVNANGDCGTGGNPDPDGENCADGGNWNSFCNACHYYYGGQHAGMSCGNASCHEANSIHRIKKNGGGGGTQLMLTAAGYEGDYQRPDFTPEIETVEGYVGSAKLAVTFRVNDYGAGTPGVFAESGLTGALTADDFWLFDVGGNNPRTIAGVSHTPGAYTATITMSAPLTTADLSADTLAVRPASAWGWYQGGYNNPATGVIPAQAVSAGPWPVAVTSSLAIVKVEGQTGYDRLHVQFSEPVYANPDGTGALQPADLALTDSDDGRSIVGVQHQAGWTTATLTLSLPLDNNNDLGTDTLAAVGGSVYNAAGYSMGTAPATIGEMPSPAILAVEGLVGGNKLKVTFSHWVFANPDQTGALEPADFDLTDVNLDNAKTITGVQHSAGDAFAILTLDNALIGADVGVDTLAAGGSAVFNSVGAPVGTEPMTITALTPPSITAVEGAVGLDKVVAYFSEAVYTEPGRSGALQVSDLSLTDVDDGRTIVGVEHISGTAAAILTLSAPLDSSDDVGVDTVAAASNAIYNLLDIAVGTGPVTINGNDCPTGGTRFDFGEPAGSTTTTDDTGLLVGQVGNPTLSMQGDGLYTGDPAEAQWTYVDVDNNDMCLKSPRILTLESRFFMDDVDLDYVDVSPANGIDDDYDAGGPFSRDGDGRNTTATRIAERNRTFQFTIMRGNWAGDQVAARAGKARVMFKYRVTDRGYCDGSYPGDPTIGDGAWMKQISSDIERYPIVSGHWYQVRIVFNTDQPRLAVDIWADDQGTDGSDTGELWAGYRNITQPDPEDSAGCKWAALPGLEMATEDQYLYIGDNATHQSPQDDPGDYRNTMLKGKIDWFRWKPVADYGGVDDPPYGDLVPARPSRLVYLPLVMKD